ncbi:MAG: hypothetical protein IJ701_02310 [Bacteroidales bacterium]|nr:hypothetical protein [Bacteroidales bacterium]MBR1678272.1 hypothetical protein [Bacteroidales bacterium]
MKKILIVVAALLGFAVVASAQPRALGVRAGYGGELSYQHYMGGENFAEFDLGWSSGFINVAAAYDFQVAPVGPFNFYAGPAADLWLVNEGGIGLGVGGQLGLEYLFSEIPLQISLDWRPMFNLIPATSFGWSGFGLGIRYLF